MLPLTGVTLPFISSGGSSMGVRLGADAFLKASDERTYAARRASRKSLREDPPAPPSWRGEPPEEREQPAPPRKARAPRGGAHARPAGGRHSRKEA